MPLPIPIVNVREQSQFSAVEPNPERVNSRPITLIWVVI